MIGSYPDFSVLIGDLGGVKGVRLVHGSIKVWGEMRTVLGKTNRAYPNTGFFFDRFSASRPSGFAETLSFLLEFLSFFSKF